LRGTVVQISAEKFKPYTQRKKINVTLQFTRIETEAADESEATKKKA